MEQQEQKSYDPVLAAKLLLALGLKNGFVLNVTKVQKILFIIYGYYLSKYNRAIFNDSPRAWPYGPVFPSTRTKVDFEKAYQLEDPELSEITQDQELVTVFEKVVKTYAPYSAAQLTAWSHMKGSPWEKTTQQENFNWNMVIPDPLIKSYFQEETVLDD